MAGQVSQIPRHRGIGQRDDVGKIHQRDIIEFRPADALRLQNPEQAGLVKLPLGFGRKTPRLLGLCGTFAEFRNKRVRALQHLRIRSVLTVWTPFQLKLVDFA